MKHAHRRARVSSPAALYHADHPLTRAARERAQATDHPELAIEPLERSLAQSPAGMLAVHPHFNLAVAYFSLDRYDEAITHLDEALAQSADPFFAVSSW